jgi:hypothetical protein
MRASFIESSGFTEWLTRHILDETYAALQLELMANPEKGDVMPGCGGLRKVRVGDPARGKGKRGGARVIYLYVPEAKWFFMLDIYGKNERDDLNADQRKQLSKLAANLKAEALQAIEKPRKRKRE